MSILNWTAAKVLGFPTIDENCRDAVVIFLTKHHISYPKFSFVKGEVTRTNPRFRMRVYYGNGVRDGEEVAFVLSVSEDLVYPDGALVKQIDKGQIEGIRREWLGLDPVARFTLYGFVLEKCGGEMQPLDPHG